MRRTIVSSDREEMIVGQPNEVDAVRKTSGIEVRPKSVPEGALVGDGGDNRAVFNLIGRMIEPGILNTAIKGHFYKAGIESVDGENVFIRIVSHIMNLNFMKNAINLRITI